jgi:hypothetical protein
MIPVLDFSTDATLNKFEKVLEKSSRTRDFLKQLHKEIGGSGEGDHLILFRTDIEPQVKGIPLRGDLSWLKEAKFWSGTKIRVIEIIH